MKWKQYVLTFLWPRVMAEYNCPQHYTVNDFHNNFSQRKPRCISRQFSIRFVTSLHSKRSRTKKFSAFWPRVNWSFLEFLLSLQFTHGQNAEKLFVRKYLLRRLIRKLFTFSWSALLSLFWRLSSIVSRFIKSDDRGKSDRVGIMFLAKTYNRLCDYRWMSCWAGYKPFCLTECYSL